MMNLESLGWIPVRSKLPKSGLAQILITNGKFVCVSKARILAAYPDVVTHWMPLILPSITSRKSGKVL